MLQKKSYFSASYHGYTTRGAQYLFFSKKNSSMAFRYDHISAKVILDDYDNRQPHTTTSFLFTLVSVPSVVFLKKAKEQNNGCLWVTSTVLTIVALLCYVVHLFTAHVASQLTN